MDRERSIQLDNDGQPLSELADCLVPTPVEMWRAWIREIISDPTMSRDRIMRHLQAHVGQHIPNADAPDKRWQEWLAGTYNMLAILSANLGIDPPHDVGIDLLMRKYLASPADHTPPPKTVKKRAKLTPEQEFDGS